MGGRPGCGARPTAHRNCEVESWRLLGPRCPACIGATAAAQHPSSE